MTADGTAYVVRVATAADDAQLVRIDRESYTPKADFPSSHARRVDSFFSLRNPPDINFVADDRGRLLGYVRIRSQLDDVPESAHVLAIHGLAVTPQARRRGVATALMREAEAQARARGARKLSLRMFGGNDSARALYTRLGYLVEGVLREEYLIDGEYVDDVLMTRWLT